MWRKVIFNLIAGFVLLPLISFMTFYYQEVRTGNWTENPFSYESGKFLHSEIYGLIEVLFLILILIPFQLLKNHRFKRGYKMGFLKRWLILTLIFLIVIFIFAVFTYGAIAIPWWRNYIYIVLSIIIALVFSTFLYFTVDRYVEKK